MYVIAAAIIAISLVGFVWMRGGASDQQAQLLRGVPITVYKSPTCGCCGEYVTYLKQQGAEVEVIVTEKVGEIKSKYKVPQMLESCHTSIVGGYVVEGHVPAEAIKKLLDEKPAIAGITLPEMPAGSPGMGGTKVERFKVNIITKEGADGGLFIEL